MSDTKVKITPEQFIAEVRRVAAERPNYVYENPSWSDSGLRGFCKYMHGDEPGCIIGTAAHNLGVTLPEGGGVLEVLATNVPDLYEALKDEQRFWLTSVQFDQDNGQTWQEAVSRADMGHPGV